MKKSKARSVFIGVCVAPAVILFIIFMLVPTFNIFKMSLYKWGGFSNSKEFIGLNNFKTLLADTKFLRTFQNSILLVVCVTVITISFSLIFAAFISREKIKGENFFRIIFYIPNILSIVIISAIFSAIYDPTNGLLNSVLGIFRGEKDPILWLGDQKIVIFSLGIARVWQAIGYSMVMYMASMASIPASIYESADLEGANHIQQFFSITLPLIWTNIRTTLSFFVISTINLSFQLVKVLTNGGPDGATDVFLSYMYNQAYTNSSYGYGMAIGVVVFLFSFGLAAVISFVTKREPLEF